MVVPAPDWTRRRLLSAQPGSDRSGRSPNHASRIAPAFDDGSTVRLALDAGLLPVRAHLP